MGGDCSQSFASIFKCEVQHLKDLAGSNGARGDFLMFSISAWNIESKPLPALQFYVTINNPL